MSCNWCETEEGFTEVEDAELAKMELEIEFLSWIYSHMDFGPAHEEVLESLKKEYTAETGRAPPEGY